MNININRGELTALLFSIIDAANGLAGKRVTWSVARVAGGPRVLRKVSGLPGSSADITIATQTAGSITGTINILLTDYATMTYAQYVASLWIDSDINDDRCVTPGGVDQLVITDDVPRAP
jgi:hypothetical protein